jgi:hypothetical protein
MFKRTRMLTAVLVLAMGVAPVACSRDEGNERWATTHDTNVEIDWDKVNEAYKLAEGPEDLERRINDIYQGDEVVSIAVRDLDEKVQEVTGFFDKNSSGAPDSGEEIFTMKRTITGAGAAQLQTQGHGTYAGYHSPMLSIMTGMMLGSMMSNMFSPGYRPMYTRAYVTSPTRTSQLRGSRAARAARVGKPSATGRSYPTRGPRGGGMRGGGRFGVQRSTRTAIPARLTA